MMKMLSGEPPPMVSCLDNAEEHVSIGSLPSEAALASQMRLDWRVKTRSCRHEPSGTKRGDFGGHLQDGGTLFRFRTASELSPTKKAMIGFMRKSNMQRLAALLFFLSLLLLLYTTGTTVEVQPRPPIGEGRKRVEKRSGGELGSGMHGERDQAKRQTDGGMVAKAMAIADGEKHAGAAAMSGRESVSEETKESGNDLFESHENGEQQLAAGFENVKVLLAAEGKTGKADESSNRNMEGNVDVSDMGRETFSCNRTHWRTDVCVMRGDVRVDARSDIFMLYAKERSTPRGEEKVKPYTRKWETSCMENVQELTLTSIDIPEGLPPLLLVATEDANVASEGEVEKSGTSMQKRLLDYDSVHDSKTEPEKPGTESYWELVRKVKNQSRSGMAALWSKRLNPDLSQLTFFEVVRQKEDEEAIANGVVLDPIERGWREKKWVEGAPFVNRTEGGLPLLKCDVYHSVPAIVFSTAGYTGNLYHEFHDGLIPIYITSQHYKKEVVFIVVQAHIWWFMKYEQVIRQMSNYPVVLLGQNDYVHCFREVTVGMRIHDELTVDPTQMAYGGHIQDFQRILQRAWEKWPFRKPPPEGERYGCRPLLSIISREGTRVLTNEEEVKRVAEEEGYFVQILLPSSTTALQDMWHSLQESNAMLGVHGAGMTHFLFMRPNSAYLQVVPLGTDWAAKTYYGDPSIRLGLQYEEYKISIKESSLSLKYPPGDPVLEDPQSILDKGWWAGKEIYLENQNVTLNLQRIRKVLRGIRKKKLVNDPLYVRQKAEAKHAKRCRPLLKRNRGGEMARR